VRAFSDQALSTMERGAAPEVKRLCVEVRRLYAAEDAAQNNASALIALLSATHQQLHAAARTLESAIRLNTPPQEPPGQVKGHGFRFLGEDKSQPGDKKE
jgi:hypothetical protein